MPAGPIKKLIRVLTVLSLLSIGSQSWSDCATVIEPTPFDRWNVLSAPDQYRQMLVMLGTTQSNIVSLKEIIKKNSLELGVALSNNRMLLLTYEVQNQNQPRSAWLQKVEVISSIGRVVSASKDPIDEATMTLKPIEVKDDLELPKEIAGATFPASIDSDLLTRMTGSERYFSAGPRVSLDHVKPSELRTKSPGWLMSVSQTRKIADFINRKFTPNFFRSALVIGGVALFLGNSEDVRPLTIVSRMAHMGSMQASRGQEGAKQPPIKEIVQSIKDNQDIEPVDKNWLVSHLQSGDAHRGPGLTLRSKDIQVVPGTDTGTFLIRQRSTGKIFVGVLNIQDLDKGTAEMRIVEIPDSNMPNTFARLSKMFPETDPPAGP